MSRGNQPLTKGDLLELCLIYLAWNGAMKWTGSIWMAGIAVGIVTTAKR
jgi:hypothetical protein